MKKPFLVVTLVLVALGCFAAGWRLHPLFRNNDRLPVLGTVPSYTLTNQLGHRVSSTAFAGKVRVVTFLFPYCTGYCPLIAHNFASLAQELKASGLYDHVQLVAFDVDPGDTGPAQMRSFQQQYGWNPEDTHWQYLTGEPKEIRSIVREAYHVSYQKVSTASEAREAAQEKQAGTYIPQPIVRNNLAAEANVDYDIVHNDALVIVDTRGRIRRYFHAADRVSNEQIIHIINQLLPPGSKTATP